MSIDWNFRQVSWISRDSGYHFCCPDETRCIFVLNPGTKIPGYCLSSLWDYSEVMISCILQLHSFHQLPTR